MRRPVGLVLVGVGTFLLALVPLMRFYVEDQVVAAPRNFYQATRLEARNASYFDAAELKMRRGVTLVARNNVRGDVRAPGGNKIAVWDSSTSISDKDRDKQIETQDYRIAFDRRTSELTDCCGSHVGGDTGVRFSGYGLLFPLADVRKKDYSFFDVTTRRAWPMRFDGEERIQGLRAYRFVQQVQQTKVARVGSVPGPLLGLGRKSGNVQADRYYAAKITVWVDPRTGSPLKHIQAIRTTVQTPDGRGRLTAAAADLVTVEADQKKLAARSDDNAFVIEAVRTYIPAGALAGGLLLMLVGGVMFLGGSRGRRGAAGGRPRGGADGPGANGPGLDGPGVDRTGREGPQSAAVPQHRGPTA